MSTIRDFVPLSKLGEGTYSTVYKVKRNTDQQVYALKKVKMNQLSIKEKENALNEIRILASIESPSVISYKDAFFDQTINVLCIVMEYADEGDLLHQITEAKKRRVCIEERQIWLAIKNILMGLQILHSRGIMHRDLKSANVFKSKSGYKLGDLNVSKVVAGQLAYTQTGTPYYASPQVWRDQPYDAKSDIWSLGCIIFEMATLRPPFQGKSMEDLFKSIQNRPAPPIPSNYSSDLVQFIQVCLRKKPSQRLTASELLNYHIFQKYFKDSSSDIGHLLIRNHNQSMGKQKLLNTIKLPSDLTKLKEKLPSPKYQMQNKSLVELGNIQSSVKSPKNIPSTLNKSDIYRSPSAKIASNDVKVPPKSPPISEIKLNPQAYNIIAKYSDRLSLSDKKSNKMERPVQQSYLNIEKYIRQELTRRPSSQNSLPKTQKMVGRKEAYSSVAAINSEPYLRNDMDDMRQRLVKKSRVVSSKAKPSWWG